MAGKLEVLLLTTEAQTEDAVVSTLGDDSRFSVAGVCHDMVALRLLLERAPIPVVLVDLDPDPMHVLEDLRATVDRLPHSRFIALTSALTAELVLAAMQIGVRHVQLKASIPKELPAAVQRVAPATTDADREAAAPRGALLTVLSAAGGSGSTTLAVNLANELQLLTGQPTLLVDLDYSYGAVAAYLDVHAQYSVSDVLHYDGVIDAQLIMTTAVRHSENLHVLVSPASINLSEAQPIQPNRLDTLLEACRAGHQFTVVDAPRVPMNVAGILAQHSESNLIVLQPMVKDIRIAKAIITALLDRGVVTQRLRPVMTRCSKYNQMIGMKEAQEVLGGIPVGQVSNDYPSAIKGINYGRTLADTAPRSALRKDLMRLAQQISDWTRHHKGEPIKYESR